MTLGEKIKFARTRKNMSQADLGERSETHQKNISKYEKDAVIPSAITLKKIADALEVTTDYLLGTENESTIKDVALLKQFKEVDHLDENEKNALMIVIAAFLRDARTRQAYS